LESGHGRQKGSERNSVELKQKIEKLLALSESTNESEAMSAARITRKLVLKYHISMAEGERADRERLPVSNSSDLRRTPYSLDGNPFLEFSANFTGGESGIWIWNGISF
jgi:hypothetical protein